MIIPVKTLTGEYNVVLRHGALAELGSFLNLNRKVLIVTDSGVPEIYAKTVALQCKEPYTVTVEMGESSKNFDNFKMLLSKMIEFGFSRTDCVVAVGGGVVGDLSGFVASAFMRGVDFYNIPTTVLSQVDSSIGGKVAINFCNVKNTVGAFFPPRAVIIDPDTLKTLPKRHISNGLSESVKMALTFDCELFKLFEEGDPYNNIDKIIERSLLLKKMTVEEDEKENGIRKVLNFGHTVAHAVESENMGKLFHGECVAIGMLPMCSNKVKARLIPVLKKLGLPFEFKVVPEKIIKIIKHDKKISGDDITVIYVENVGEYVMKTLPFSEFAKSLRGEL